MKIDSHQHFWKYDPIRYGWIDNQMDVLKQDFLPVDILPHLQKNQIEGCVAVQADQSLAETDFLLKLANENPFVVGVVGWLDLCSHKIEEELEKYHEKKLLKGLRHILQGESQRDFMLRNDFINGISHLEKYDLAYDILIFDDQIRYSEQLVKQFPNQSFVIDHLAKPKIANQEFDKWAKDMRSIAKYENVSCKISGMVTEAQWKTWKESDYRIYLDLVVEAFGTDRLMYGSDWPVCLLSATYDQTYGIIENYFKSFSEAEKAKIFGLNAMRFYNIKDIK